MVMLGKFDKKNRDMQINPLFFILKVHIKYEKRKNAAIKLSIKDLKGLLEVV